MSAAVSCSIERGVDRVRGPDPGVAVGLELEPDRCRRRALAIVADPVVGAEQVLHVVAVLVREHVRLGEPPAVAPRTACAARRRSPGRGTPARRPGSRTARPTSRRRRTPVDDLAVEQHRLRRRVALHRAGPVLLHRVDDPGDEAVVALVGVGAGLAVRRQLAGTVERARARPSPAAAEPVGEQEHDDEDDAHDPAPADGRAAAEPDAPSPPSPPPAPRRSDTWLVSRLPRVRNFTGRCLPAGPHAHARRLSAARAAGRARARRARCAGSRSSRRRWCRRG